MLTANKLELPCLLLIIVYSASTVQRTTARVQLGFGENDYSNAEGVPLSISISRYGQSSEITVTVTAITFEQYQQRAPVDQPCDDSTLERARSGQDYAEASDFAAGVFSGRIPSGTRQEDGYVIINLFNDTILEMNEVFVLILNTNHPNVTILRRCALGVIRENFHTSVRFEFSLTADGDRSLVEHAGTINSLRILKHGQVEFTIFIQITTHGSADEGEGLDYTLDIVSRENEPRIVSMRPQDTSIDIPITINDDPIAEETEQFRIVGQLTDVIIDQIVVEFQIADNDYAQMGFINESRVVVLEGLSVTLCASLINITVENFQRYNQHVDIYTESGTALENKHFTPQRKEGLSFIKVDRSNPHCITIPTVNDTTREGSREFEVKNTDTVGTTPHPLNILHPVLITVVIIEEDKVCGEDGLFDVPYEPLITYFNHTGAGKMLQVTWTNSVDEDARHPIDQYSVTFRVSQKNDGMVHTHVFIVSNTAVEYTLDNIDEDQLYGVEICAVNTCGESCDEIPLTGTAVPITRAPPNVIIIIVVVIVFVLILLLFLLLSLLLFGCLWYRRVPKPALISPTHHTQHFVQLQKRNPPCGPDFPKEPVHQQQQQLLL